MRNSILDLLKDDLLAWEERMGVEMAKTIESKGKKRAEDYLKLP